MKIKKLIAILLVILLFEIFFEVGLFLNRPVTSIIIPEKTQVIEKIIFVNNTVFSENETEREASVLGVGVHSDNKSGELVEINLLMKPGTGRIFVDSTFHSFGIDIQDSLSIIKAYVEDYTNKNLDYVDIYLKVYSLAHQIQGTSGSAAMTVGLIALVENRQVRDDVVMTGALLPTGRIGSIDGLDQKIEVAEDHNLNKMLIPKSQCSSAPTFSTIQIVCVRDIDEAVDEMLI